MLNRDWGLIHALAGVVVRLHCGVARVSNRGPNTDGRQASSADIHHFTHVESSYRQNRPPGGDLDTLVWIADRQEVMQLC